MWVKGGALAQGRLDNHEGSAGEYERGAQRSRPCSAQLYAMNRSYI